MCVHQPFTLLLAMMLLSPSSTHVKANSPQYRLRHRTLSTSSSTTTATEIAASASGNDNGTNHNITCRIVALEVELEDPSSPMPTQFMCEDQMALTKHHDFSMRMYEIPQKMTLTLNEQPIPESELLSGNTIVSIPQTDMLDGHYEATEPSSTQTAALEPWHRLRQLKSSPKGPSLRVRLEGDNIRLLVVRVVGADGGPGPTRQDLAQHVFGDGDTQPINLRDQIRACSFGKFQIEPATGPTIEGGVTEVFLDRNLTNVDTSVFENELVRQSIEQVGGNRFDHHIYCLPPGATFRGRRFLAYGYLNHWRTVFRDEWCINFSVLAHELGHNLNLMHSGEGASVYGDLTGIMGFASRGEQATCFNANKHHLLGWYRDRTIEIELLEGSPSWGGILAPFVDYDKIDAAAKEFVIIKIGCSLYLQYNLARDFNAGTRELPNQVVVVESESLMTASNLVGGILPLSGTTFQLQDFEGSGYDLVIEVCALLEGDRIWLSVHADQLGESTCHRDLTISPSSMPSDLTDFPSLAPSYSPSSHPSMEPTPIPTTSIPSLVPSEAPSFDICEDKPGYFTSYGSDLIKCDALARDITLKQKLCVPVHAAYYHCEDTCGMCADDCEDSPDAMFIVNRRHGYKDCRWLSVRTSWQKLLCKEDHKAFEVCGETCNNPKCKKRIHSSPISATIDSPSPSTQPSVVPTSSMERTSGMACEDSKDVDFFVDEQRGRRNCIWLARASRGLQQRLCMVGREARDVCPELCGACEDSCHDNEQALIHIHKSIGYKTCRWLSIRPGPAGRLCQPGTDAWHQCKETCESCQG